MRVLPTSEEAIVEAMKMLARGGVVAHATETCYGLACDLTNPQAVEKLFTLKKRPLDQPVSALFPSTEEAKRYVVWNARAEELAQKHLPGPLTIILPLRGDSPAPLFTVPPYDVIRHTTYDIRTCGIRISSHPIAQALAGRFGKPLSTTSANLHGKPPPYSAEEITSQMEPDLVLASGSLPKTQPSTVINLAGEFPSTKRQGPLHIS